MTYLIRGKRAASDSYMFVTIAAEHHLISVILLHLAHCPGHEDVGITTRPHLDHQVVVGSEHPVSLIAIGRGRVKFIGVTCNPWPVNCEEG